MGAPPIKSPISVRQAAVCFPLRVRWPTAFSHPAVEAFNYFGVGPDVNRYTGNNLFLDGGILTPAYQALRSSLVDKLRTLAEGPTDANGQLKYRGFQGEYEATVKTPTGTAAVG